MDSSLTFTVISDSTDSEDSDDDVCHQDDSVGCKTPFYKEECCKEQVELFEKKVDKDGSDIWDLLGPCSASFRVLTKNVFYMCIQRKTTEPEIEPQEKNCSWLLQEQIMPYSYFIQFKKCQHQFDFMTEGLQQLSTDPVNLDEYLMWKMDPTSCKLYLIHFKDSATAEKYLNEFIQFKLTMETQLEKYKSRKTPKNNKYWDPILKRTVHCQLYESQMEKQNDKPAFLKQITDEFQSTKKFRKVSLQATSNNSVTVKDIKKNDFYESVGCQLVFFNHDEKGNQIPVDLDSGILSVENNTDFTTMVRFFDIQNNRILLQCPLSFERNNEFQYTEESGGTLATIEWYSDKVTLDRQIAMKNSGLWEHQNVYCGKIHVKFPLADRPIVDELVKLFQNKKTA